MKKRNIVLLLVFAALLFLHLTSVAQAAEDSSPSASNKFQQEGGQISGFLGNSWGTDFKQVEKSIIERGATNVGKLYDNSFSTRAVGMTKLSKEYTGLGANTLINGQEHFIVLSFYNDQFYRAYAEKEVAQAAVAKEFEEASNILQEKYGAPKEILGKELNLVKIWEGPSDGTANNNSIRLSIEMVPVMAHHYTSYASYRISPNQSYFIILEYQYGRFAALVDPLTVKSNVINEY